MWVYYMYVCMKDVLIVIRSISILRTFFRQVFFLFEPVLHSATNYSKKLWIDTSSIHLLFKKVDELLSSKQWENPFRHNLFLTSMRLISYYSPLYLQGNIFMLRIKRENREQWNLADILFRVLVQSYITLSLLNLFNIG